MNLSRIFGNASANIVKIFVSIIATLLLPRILLHTLSPTEYAVWVLIVQISIYSNYLDIGFSTLTGRTVAYLRERGEHERLSQTVSSGVILMLSLALVASAGILIAVLNFHRIFPDVPPDAQQAAALSLLIVGIVMSFRLPFWILGGVFIGLQRNEYSLATFAFSKIGVVIAAAIVALFGGGLLAVAIAYSAATAVANFVELYLYRRVAPDIPITLQAFHRESVRELARNSIGFGVWQISILLVTSLDLVIVGKWDFAHVAPYSFGLTLVSFVRQIQLSSVSVAMPVAAALTGRDEQHKLNDLLLSSTRLGVLLLYLGGLPLIAASAFILTIWVGTEWIEATTPLLTMLVIAAIIRQSSYSFSMMVVGVGRQNQVILSPLVGAVINVVISVTATIRFGAIGCALGTLIGGTLELLMHIFYNLPRIKELTIKPRSYFITGWVIPFLAMLPAIGLTAAWLVYGNPAANLLATAGVGILVALLVLLSGWFLVLSNTDRQRLQRLAQSILQRLSGKRLPGSAAT